MVKETKELDVNGTLFYWSNAAGDLFDPHNKDENGSVKDISESNLPEELKNAWDHLWSEDTGSYCYLIEHDGKFGIMLINEYAEEDKMSHDDIRGRGEEVLKMAEDIGLELEVYAGLEDGCGAYGMTDELITVFPCDTDPKKFEAVAEFLYNAAYKKDVTYDAYKDTVTHHKLNLYEQNIDQAIEEKSDLDVIREAYTASDKKESAAYLADIMMDDAISTYGLFEDLAVAYINGSEEFRRGLDTAAKYLTDRSIREMSENVIEMAKEREAEQAER